MTSLDGRGTLTPGAGAGGTSTQAPGLSISIQEEVSISTQEEGSISIQEERDTRPLVPSRCRGRGSSATGAEARVQIAGAGLAREWLRGVVIATVGSRQSDSSKIQIVSLGIAQTHLNYFGNKVHNLIVFFQDAVYFSKG